MVTATARAGDTVDAICWRELGRTQTVTEQVLELNPGLAEFGPTIPAGTVVILPELIETARPTLETVQLWD